MDELAEAVLSGVRGPELMDAAVPEKYLALHTRREDVERHGAAGVRDVRDTLHLDYVPMPELAPDEVLIAVMASSINFNTVWAALFEPIPTFRFLESYGKRGLWQRRHDQPYHVVGSDASGVIVRKGTLVARWNVGDEVVVATASIDSEDPDTYADGMRGSGQLIWGFETNFGGLAHYTIARVSQLLPKEPALTWAEAASNPLCAGTAYRMLVSEHGANLKQGQSVLIWGAAGGLGTYASQFVQNGGGYAIGIVATEDQAATARTMGCEFVFTQDELGLTGTDEPELHTTGRRVGNAIRDAIGDDPDIVFEHVGQATFPLSVFLAKRNGTIVTSGSSSGYRHTYDNRYLWMRLKRIVGSHSANLAEQMEVNRLVRRGKILPATSAIYALQDAAEASAAVHRDQHVGKMAIRVLAQHNDDGISDPDERVRLGIHAPLMKRGVKMQSKEQGVRCERTRTDIR